MLSPKQIHTLKSALDNFYIVFNQTNKNEIISDYYISIFEIEHLKKVINSLLEFDFLYPIIIKTAVIDLLDRTKIDVEFGKAFGDSFVIYSFSTKSNILSGLEIINESIRAILLLTESENSFTDDTIIAKINDNIKLQELEKISNDLYKIVEIPILDSKFNETNVVIKTVSKGSILLVITISAAAVGLIAKICKAALSIQHQNIQNQKQQEELKRMKLDNKAFESVVNAHSNYIKSQLDENINEIMGEFYSDNDIEKYNRLKNSIELYSQISQKELFILPATDKQKDEFPDFDFGKVLTPSKKELPNSENKNS